MEKHKRDPYWDIVKGVAIILVVIGHATTLVFGENEECYHTLLWKFIYSMHMPLFMIVSGYFFLFSLRKDALTIIRKRFVQLLLPIIIISFFDYSINYYTPPLRFPETIIDLYARYLSSLWFLRALFYCSVIILIGNKFFKDHPVFYFLVILLSILVPERFHSEGTQAMIPFFIFGYFFNKYNLSRLFLSQNKTTLIVTGVLYAILLYFMNPDVVWYFNGVSILNKKMPVGMHLYYDIFRIIIGIVGSLFVLQIVDTVYKAYPSWKGHTFLSKIGLQTLWIYIIHSYMLRLFKPISPFPGTTGMHYIQIILLSILLLSASYLLIIGWNAIIRSFNNHKSANVI